MPFICNNCGSIITARKSSTKYARRCSNCGSTNIGWKSNFWEDNLDMRSEKNPVGCAGYCIGIVLMFVITFFIIIF